MTMCINDKNENPNCRRYREQIEALAAESTLRMPTSLARHVETCESCQTLLDKITKAQYLLDRAKWRSMPMGTLALCNLKAMKKLQHRVRETAKARKLGIAQPDLPGWQQATIRLTRGGIGVAAGLAVVMFNWAASGGLNVTQDQLQRLADVHQRHHIGDWSNPSGDDLT
jgi:hypothetical protein